MSFVVFFFCGVQTLLHDRADLLETDVLPALMSVRVHKMTFAFDYVLGEKERMRACVMRHRQQLCVILLGPIG